MPELALPDYHFPTLIVSILKVFSPVNIVLWKSKGTKNPMRKQAFKARN